MQTRATRRLYGRRQPSVKDMFPMAPENDGKRQCPLCLERIANNVPELAAHARQERLTMKRGA